MRTTDLTPHAQQIIDLIVIGYANKRIALELGISEQTVKHHVSYAMKRLKLKNRVQLATKRVLETEGLAR